MKLKLLIVAAFMGLLSACSTPPADLGKPFNMPSDAEIMKNIDDPEWVGKQLAAASRHGKAQTLRNQLNTLACQPIGTGTRKIYQVALPAGCGIDNRQVVVTGSHVGGVDGGNNIVHTEELTDKHGRPIRALHRQGMQSESFARIAAQEAMATARAVAPVIADHRVKDRNSCVNKPDGCTTGTGTQIVVAPQANAGAQAVNDNDNTNINSGTVTAGKTCGVAGKPACTGSDFKFD